MKIFKKFYKNGFIYDLWIFLILHVDSLVINKRLQLKLTYQMFYGKISWTSF